LKLNQDLGTTVILVTHDARSVSRLNAPSISGGLVVDTAEGIV
jgi:ABC-type lipoprotein export system ATPase subunit